MKSGLQKIIALFCVLAVMLAGCGMDIQEYLQNVAGEIPESSGTSKESYIAFADMEYTRPDMDVLMQSLDAACEAAEGEDFDEIIDKIYEFYEEYDSFYTNLSLADIYCSADLTDTHWDEEYGYCMENSGRVDAALEELYYALAASPCREKLEGKDYFGEGYFDSYEGENLWDEEFTTLLEQEAELQNRYYELSTLGLEYDSASEEYYTACGNDMMELLVELIRVRQEMAAFWGYNDYVQFATDYYYYRDYTPQQTEDYLEEIRQELVPVYTHVYASGPEASFAAYCTEQKTYDFVSNAAKNMGGKVEEAFDLLEKAELFDISYGENKYNSSFEVYLTSYAEPFVFMNPSMTVYDQLTFAHEFGHFCNDYASYGSTAGVDVLEVFSQGMEYLSLCYGDGNEDLRQLKLWDSLCLFVEQAAFASFEMQMYNLQGDDLTVENLRTLYDQVARDYGFKSVGYDDREFVTINHYYTHPMYIISYIVSNDTAMQLYQLEQEESGAGLKCFEDNLTTEESYFLEFVEEAGLESPFEDGRMQSVRQTFEEIFVDN